jgi:predicted dehydrogenase
VTAVADVADETACRRAAELDAAAYTDFRQMILEAELDAVDICLPHHLHAEAIVAAAQAGKHILCEKPLCLTVEQAHQVRQAVSAAGVTLMCAHNQLYLPAVAKAKELLDQGVLGAVYEVRTTDCFYNDFHPESIGWRASVVTSGGGELMDTGYHPTYLMLHFACGSPMEATALLSRHRLSFMEGPVRQWGRRSAAHKLGVRPAAGHRAVLDRRREWHATERWNVADAHPARIEQ